MIDDILPVKVLNILHEGKKEFFISANDLVAWLSDLEKNLDDARHTPSNNITSDSVLMITFIKENIEAFMDENEN